MKQNTDHRIEYLDSLRGIASVVVFGAHFVAVYGLSTSSGNVSDWNPVCVLWDGFAAVSLFFVLSGFVLSLKQFSRADSGDTRNWLFSYFVVRIFRIAPPYVCAVLLSAIALHFVFDRNFTPLRPPDWVLEFWKHEIPLRQIIRDAFLLEQVNERRLVPQGWTLAVELKFSLFIPFLVLIHKYGRKWFVAFVLICTLLLKVNYFVIHFALGVGIAGLVTSNPNCLVNLHRAGKVFLLLGGFLFLSVHSWAGRVPSLSNSAQATFILSGLGAALVLVSCLLSSSIQKILSKRILLFLGRISYSFYLLHLIVIFCIIPPLVRALPWYHEVATRAFALIAAFGTTAILSVAFYYLTEKPSIAVGKRVALLIFRDKVSATGVGASSDR